MTKYLVDLNDPGRVFRVSFPWSHSFPWQSRTTGLALEYLDAYGLPLNAGRATVMVRATDHRSARVSVAGAFEVSPSLVSVSRPSCRTPGPCPCPAAYDYLDGDE